ncbi:hypothetical protein [Roseomonas elaeocarpi]|uniref:Lipoprotein n=1 Tax=Roseomonas elaeocarpi TaxID=907779 RepID=A0ABV6JUH3_9PROT
MRRRSFLHLLPAATLASGVLALSACAELRTPRRLVPPPPGLLNDSDPGHQAVSELDRSFRNGGAALRGDQAATARAAAILEWLSVDLAANPRWNPIPTGVKERVYAGRDEMRASLGVLANSPGEEVATELARAARELSTGHAGRASDALPARHFRDGGDRTLERLKDAGPLPNCEIALGALAREVTRLDETSGWIVQPATDPGVTGTRALQPGY